MLSSGLVFLVLASVITRVESLTCLQCNDVPQPRHCDTVAACEHDEICGVEETINGFGDVLYNVGCMKQSKCSSNRSHCIECCTSDLCNNKGCGETGYPENRGPICYNCPVHTVEKKCHKIDICAAGEVCMLHGRREFGDLVFSSGCVDDHACRQSMIDPGSQVVGRSLDRFNDGARSLREHVCHECCHSDLCNTNCSAHTTQSSSRCQPNTCLHGRCIDGANGYVCRCQPGYVGAKCETPPKPKDCYDIRRMNASAVSGLYSVFLWRSHREIRVFCDMDTDNGGWTVFQRRINGVVSFNRTFVVYENGFGDMAGEFWLGLTYVEEMTGLEISELRLDLTDSNGTRAYEVFRNFSLGMPPKYTLHIEPGTGTAGDKEGLSYNNGRDFKTFDMNDNGCAKKGHSGWWFSSCSFTNLNAVYVTPGTWVTDAGFEYYSFRRGYSMKEAKMMFRRMNV